MTKQKARLIEIIREELNRQAEASTTPSLCIYAEEPTTIGVDGPVNLDELAQLIVDRIECNCGARLECPEGCMRMPDLGKVN